MNKLLSIMLLVCLLPACSSVISDEYVQKAVKGTGFDQVREKPEAFMNSIFILGGTIVAIENAPAGTELEVIENPVNQYGQIIDRDVSNGRFILMSDKQLDPAIFRRNRLITVAAKLAGTRTKQLNGQDYVYPVFESKQIFLWKKERMPSMYEPYSYPFYYYQYPYYWNDPYFRGPAYYPMP